MSSNTFPSPPIARSPPGDPRVWWSVLKSVLPGGPHDRERPELTPVLACGVLVLALIVQLVLPSSHPLTEASPLAPRRPKPVVAPPVPDYAAILAAPIFSPDRKPGEDEDSAPGSGALDGFAALGVATGRGFATALLKGPDGVVSTLRVGDSVQGWRLVGVESAKLTFQRDTARHVVPVGAPTTTPAAQNGNDE